MKHDIYQAITDRILELLDAGTVPWRNPIKRSAAGNGLPKSLASGKAYRGINVFLLAATAWCKGYESCYWTTYRAAQAAGAQVRKGEKSTLVIFWKQYAVTDAQSGEEKNLPVLRHYHVFNAEQVEGIEPPDRLPPDDTAAPFEPLLEAEKIITGYARPPTIEYGGQRAFYIPSEDRIRIAEPARFASREEFYGTLYHEFCHSTGHSSRLNRELDSVPTVFGSPSYGKEELIAEFGGAFLAAAAGISPPTIDNSAAYIAGWRKQIAADRKLLVQAAAAGQKAADHILGISFTAAASEEPADDLPVTPSPAP